MEWGRNVNVELLNTIITNGVALIVGGTGAFVAYKGSVKGSMLQIEEERKKLQEENEEQRESYNKAIQNFISNEIRHNFITLNPDSTQWISQVLEREDNPPKYPLHVPQPGSPLEYSFKEYDNLKYELIKAGGDEVQEIIEIYDMFYLVRRKTNMKEFTQKEYEQFKKTYKVCLDKYYNS